MTMREDLDTAERQRHEEAVDCDKWRARAEAAEKRAEALKAEAEKYLTNIEERQVEFTKLVDRCLIWESEAKRFHSAFAAETLARNAAEALLREAREVVEFVAEDHHQEADQREWARSILAKLAAREGT